MPNFDNRKHPRAQVALQASYKVRGASVQGTGEIRSLSQGGFCLMTAGSSPDTHDLVEIELDLRFLPRPLKAVSQVVWRRPVEGGGQGHWVGLQFIGLEEPVHEIVKNFVHLNLPKKT